MTESRQSLTELTAYAMFTIYLRAPCGVYFTNKETVQFYGARPVTGTFFSTVYTSYGARWSLGTLKLTAPARCFVGSMRVKWHRQSTVRCPDGVSDIGRATDDYCTWKFHACKIGPALPGRALTDIIIYRRRLVPVRYVNTQIIIFKKLSGARAIFNSPMICKSINSYGGSFICDHSSSSGEPRKACEVD